MPEVVLSYIEAMNTLFKTIKPRRGTANHSMHLAGLEPARQRYEVVEVHSLVVRQATLPIKLSILKS